MVMMVGGFQSIDKFAEQNLCPDLQEWVSHNKLTKGVKYSSFNNHNYVLIALGEVSHPGYTIIIDDLKVQEEHIDVYVKSVPPEGETAYIQVIVYPYILAEIERPIVVYLDDDELSE